MNTELIAKSLCFHGQPLQKIWEGERGNHDLYRLGLVNPDYSLYTARQKGLTFQDRAKRLKLHQFIARKADTLFDNALVEELPGIKRKDKPTMVTSMVMPPFETMFSTTTDKIKNVHHLLSVIQPGDIVYGTVLSRSNSGLTLKVLCTGEPIIRYLADINIKAYVLAQNLVPAHDKKGNPRPYVTNDYVCCEVLDISADADRMTLGMKGTLTIDAKAPLGFITCEQMPDYYKRTIENQDATYDELLETSKGFQNPNSIEILFQELGLDINDTFSHMGCFKHRFPQQEYATELRQIQASKWAFRSVADGIEHFKVGRHSEAFQCLNKALNIDPRNVEGLVARGALYANSGSFKKAVEDFETALKLNPYHANARKYMGETLVALGRSYEEENRIDEARKAYKDCLNIIPHHEEAKSSLDFINGKTGQGKQLIDTSELMLPSLKISSESKKDPSINLKKHDETKKEKSSKKKKVKNRKRKTASSSSSNASSSSNSSSSESSSTSGSSSGSTDSDSSQTQKTKRKSGRNEKVRQKSLSPLSKRMALMDEQSASSGTTRYQFNQPFHLANTVAPAPTDDYDAKVRNFLEITRDEDDYESRVRKLVEEASKYRKERKVLDEKAKKKDKKKQKKMKKETKKEKRRKEKSKEKMDFDDIDNMEFKEALKIFKSLPMLDIGSKLSADLAKYEKSIEAIQSRKNQPSTSTIVSKFAPKAYAFLNDSDTESPSAINSKIDPKLVAKSNKPETIVAPKQPKTPPLQPPLPVIEKVRSVEPPKVLPPKPPIVLDKFGCFRLATTDDQKFEPARRSPSRSPRRRYSRSRSRSRFYRRSSRSPRRSRSMRRSRSRRRSPSLQRSRSFRRSRSRSIRRSVSPRRSRSRRSYSKRSHSRSRSNRRNSKSPMRRRSRSFGSVGRRWVSRSHSRSFSRSRSRSREPWHRGRRGDFRGSRGFGFRGRRGRGRSGFRGRRSPFFRHNYDDRKDYEDRNRNRDDEHSSKKRTSKKVDDGIEGKWTHDKYERAKPVEASESNEKEENWDVDPTIEEIDKIIDKAQKERKEEILQRDKNLLKKQTPTNVPF